MAKETLEKDFGKLRKEDLMRNGDNPLLNSRLSEMSDEDAWAEAKKALRCDIIRGSAFCTGECANWNDERGVCRMDVLASLLIRLKGDGIDEWQVRRNG